LKCHVINPRHILALLSALALVPSHAIADISTEFEKLARTLREAAIFKVDPPVATKPSSLSSRFAWKKNIVTTVFWVGEKPTRNNPVPNHKSSWDTRWVYNFGGFDNPDPSARRNYLPKKFTPRQNPFYVALPYNDVTKGKTKPEAPKVIPWFRDAFQKPGTSVCKGRWVAIRHNNRIVFAQWEDCGPFRTDHWQYVFGNERPRANLNQGAGLDVSPAVRDYLGMKGKDVCDWKFVDAREVPNGPWTQYGDNNTFVLKKRGNNLHVADRNNARSFR
jgi:hypothetical protein